MENYKTIYPTLLETGNLGTLNSWFDIREHKNQSYNKKRKNDAISSEIFKPESTGIFSILNCS